ncbi:hypothetical protein M2397_005889 [Pseudomonas sp. BIGb0381]|uniref:hypothetical protein n=1 Tax=Pseudomonas sp. BIGb0381 TaxID=2940608 RepID=UPI002169E3EF|nr:hypothetical protein [Pseudomonas sp. BIGb0381]MCS4315555.1 hypothetical protein [Pseudomonas sp. BIGb0381]
MNRKDALAHIKFAGYHEDSKTAMRIYIENRVSHAAYIDAYAAGRQIKANGMPCGCNDCQRSA